VRGGATNPIADRSADSKELVFVLPRRRKMNAKLYIMGAAAAALLTAGAAQAATSRYAEPSQPVAYSKLSDYMKATPSKRASGDWTNTAEASNTPAPTAATGSAADTSTTMPATAAPMDTPAPTTPQMNSGQVNNPQSTSDANAPMQTPAPADASGQTDGSSAPTTAVNPPTAK
jgi:hypothetical protein